MERIVVAQSFRDHDVPAWVLRCQETVRAFAADRGYVYRFIGDELFDRAPAWARELCAANLWSLSDVGRLEWMKEMLADDADVAIWFDIDILVFDPAAFSPDLRAPYGFSYELYFDAAGPHHGVNNAIMYFRRGSAMLDRYLGLCYDRLRASRDAPGRTSLGPDLLRSLAVDDSHVLHGTNILNFAAMKAIHDDPLKRLPPSVTSRARMPIAAANLCLNERHFFLGRDREAYDRIVDDVTRALVDPSRHANAPSKPPAHAPSRNAPCPCGSGRKYKHCHGAA